MAGKIEWIGVRPERRAEVVAVDRAEIDLENGIEGDHVTQPHRQVTIISKEQMEQVAARLGKDSVDPPPFLTSLMPRLSSFVCTLRYSLIH